MNEEDKFILSEFAYSLSSKRKLMNHFKALKIATADLPISPIQVSLDIASFKIAIRYKTETYTLYPQFQLWIDGRRKYIESFADNAEFFIGWRPYPTQHIPLFSDKLKLKHYLSEQEILTPDFSEKIQMPIEDVVVKSKVSCFGEGVKGPFKNSLEHKLNTKDGEYYEKFIPGEIVKVWFWNNRPVCLECLPMPAVTGDGKSTIKTLIQRRAEQRRRKIDFNQIASVLKYYNKNFDSILTENHRQIVDIRYGSALAEMFSYKEIVFTTNKLPELQASLETIGTALFDAVKKGSVPHLAYTVDAIYTDKSELWVLEANANPFIHPQVYVEMLYDILKKHIQEDFNIPYHLQ